jgi:hypothetical protein
MDLRVVLAGATLLLACAAPGVQGAAEPRVNVVRTPHGGLQPQAVLDGQGVLHLVYFKGDPAAGDLFYVRRATGRLDFSDPLRVNSQPSSAVAVGTIRGGQLAVGKDGRVHVAWNGSNKAQPRSPVGGFPMLYARLNDAGTAFEPQRNLMQRSGVLDGGGTVAADATGHVYVAWHALKADSPRGPEHRQVWVASSADEGKTFGPEVVANPRPMGACPCCGMRAFVDAAGTTRLLYRAATEGVHRDMVLLTSADRGQRFDAVVLDRWEINDCPMSSEAFAEGSGGVFAAWETRGQVYFARLGKDVSPVAAPGDGRGRKNPALAVNGRGEVLLAWTEGTGWQRGGALAWQVYDRSGRPTAARGRIPGAIPMWGLPTAVAERDGTFTLLH